MSGRKIFVGQDGTISIRCHVEAIPQEFLVQALNRFMQSDDVPLPAICFRQFLLFVKRSWVPTVNTEPLESVVRLVVEVSLTADCRLSSSKCIAVRCVDTLGASE